MSKFLTILPSKILDSLKKICYDGTMVQKLKLEVTPSRLPPELSALNDSVFHSPNFLFPFTYLVAVRTL